MLRSGNLARRYRIADNVRRRDTARRKASKKMMIGKEEPRAWLLYLLAGILATGGYFLLPSASTQDVFYNLVGLSSVAAIMVGVRMHRPVRPLHWYVLALGMLILNIGEVIFTFYESVLGIKAPFPSVADAFYLVAMPCFAVGLVLVHRRQFPRRQWANLINALIIATVAGMLSWIFLMEPNARDQTSSLFERLISIAYPIMDLVVLVAALQLWLTSEKRLPTYYLLSMSLVALLIADTAYAATLLAYAYETGNPLDAGWLLFFVLFGAATLHPSMRGLSEPLPGTAAKPTWRRLMLLTGASLIAPLILAYQAELDEQIEVPTIVGGSVVLFLLGATRVGLMIRERERMEQQLEHQAFHDPLTNLPNRRLFADRLEHALARALRKEGHMAVLFMDLDNFKVINDSLGHAAGDELLEAVAKRLQSCVRPEDTLSRFGGDEFALLLEDVADGDVVTEVAKRILQRLRPPFVLRGREVVVTASIGIVLAARGEERSADELLRDADLAMYNAKNSRKAQHKMFDPNLRARAFERLEVETDLRRALKRGEFTILYQPQVSLKSGRIVGFEALLRWKHSERGLIDASEFIAVAEETGLVLPLGRSVLEEVCRQGRVWQDRYPSSTPAVVSVNLSATEFQRPEIVSYLARLLKETGLPPNCLCLEITERVAMEDAPSAGSTFEELKGLGVRLAIDDFGTGHSSLSYLKRFPVDYLKIEHSFVDGLGKESEGTVIVSGIISLAHSLGRKVIAEGVERKEQLALLREMRCDQVQGHYFSKELSSEMTGELLSKGFML
jgi:diguanylate cyclase (GGDEF)-like protein